MRKINKVNKLLELKQKFDARDNKRHKIKRISNIKVHIKETVR